jgi:hypothetical protein
MADVFDVWLKNWNAVPVRLCVQTASMAHGSNRAFYEETR